MAEWAIIGSDGHGVTVELTGPDPEVLCDHAAAWAQQEADRWPQFGLLYQLVAPDEVAAARALEEETV